MKPAIIIFSFITSLTLIVNQQAPAQFKLENSVFGNGAAVSSGGDQQIVSTIGQVIIGETINASNSIKAGFWYQTAGLVVSVEQIPSAVLPTEFLLEQNYPNPFNPSTTIQFAIPKRSEVVLKLFDLLGREVVTLVDEELQPGKYNVVFEAEGLPSGIYFYWIQAESFVQTRKLTLLK